MQDRMLKSLLIHEFHRATAGLSDKELIQLANELEKQADASEKAEVEPSDLAQSSD